MGAVSLPLLESTSNVDMCAGWVQQVRIEYFSLLCSADLVSVLPYSQFTLKSHLQTCFDRAVLSATNV